MTTTAEYTSDGMLILSKPVKLPGVLDLLIVGGGPAGTAAAFRAKELGLSALVIDYDDVLKRIRDYAKDKMILPDFGGGDKMKFPKGAALINDLCFQPIDKDDMCAQWRGFYRTHSVPVQVGIELTGLAKGATGVWDVRTWNHNAKAEQTYHAKNVAIAIGRGVPRRFDIPGNTDGIAYRLSDASTYVGKPALVIGGGTSAGEAVIEISNAKIKAGDPTTIHWSYRGDKLPKVSKALADVFFEAYIGNGNIRYHPGSEPVGVVTAEDKKDYLSIRIDRRRIEGRPCETSHIEFDKTSTVACIGEDIPEAFLNSLGIFMATGGPANKKRMVVNSLLETQQPNVYLIGDILSQAYLEADDFGADPSTFREIKHRGNIKASLVDGVYVAEVAAQRVAGKKEVKVELEMVEQAPAKKMSFAATRIAAVTQIAESPGPPEQSLDPARASAVGQAYLTKVLAGNVEEDEFPLKEKGVTTIGRKECDISLLGDTLLSDVHASILHTDDGYFLRDDGSATGVFYRAPQGRPMEVSSGDLIRLGRQFLLFSGERSSFGFAHYDAQGKEINSHPLGENTIVVGRDAPDITLDNGDGTLSRRHLSLAVKDGKIFIKDLMSMNGSYLKVRTALKLSDGDLFRVGASTFKMVLKQELSSDVIHTKSRPPIKALPKSTPPAVAPPKEKSAPPSAKVTGTVVVFKNEGRSVPFTPGQSVCDIAEKNGVKISAECHAGICGSDPVRILSGKENLNPLGDDEKGTLEDICGVKPGECRLACMLKPTGAVEVEILNP